MLRISQDVADAMIAHCLRGLPDEACGLLGGDLDEGTALVLYPTDNLAHSAMIYIVDPKQHLLADRDLEAKGMSIVGVFHSHTHTEAFPSPTDVAQAPDPSWHYVIVSLRALSPSLRSYKIVDGAVTEEQVELS